jgi:hypothetical protein
MYSQQSNPSINQSINHSPLLVTLLMLCNTSFPKLSTSIKFLYIQPETTNEAPNHMSAPTSRDQQANRRFLTLASRTPGVQLATLGALSVFLSCHRSGWCLGLCLGVCGQLCLTATPTTTNLTPESHAAASVDEDDLLDPRVHVSMRHATFAPGAG